MSETPEYSYPDLTGQKCVIYARVSTPAQLNGSGIHRQIETCLEFCEKTGARYVLIHTDCGSRMEFASRAGLQAALSDVAKYADFLLVEDFDRLGAGAAAMSALDTLRAHGKRLEKVARYTYARKHYDALIDIIVSELYGPMVGRD